VFSPTPTNREAFAREMSELLGIAVDPAATRVSRARVGAKGG
jgi:hypothetical protein